MTPIRWLRNALGSMQSIHMYYADEGVPKHARTVCRVIIKTVNQLIEFPNLGRRGRVPGARELIVPQTPYIVIYREAILDRKKQRSQKGRIERSTKPSEVQILRILHSSQKWPIC